MKSINKNNLYRTLLVMISLGMGISIAEETPAQDTIPVSNKTETTSADNTQTPTATPQAQEPSFTGLITSLAVYNIARSLNAQITGSYSNTLLHPAAFVAGSVASSFVHNIYAKYNAGKLFNSGWGVLIPETVTNTLNVYVKNPLKAPLMAACALAPVWSHYVSNQCMNAGISSVYPALFSVALALSGAFLWAEAEK